MAYREERVVLTGDDGPFTVVLRDRENRLEEVIVTGIATGGNARVASSQIDRVPAILGERDVLKYLATLPGVITTNPFNSGIYVRGGNSHENGYFVRGMPIADPDHLTGILSTFDPYILGNVTLYKSGFPARYNGFLSSYLDMRPETGGGEGHEGEVTLGLLSSSAKAKGRVWGGRAAYGVSARVSSLLPVASVYNSKSEDNANMMPGYAFQDFTLAADARLSPRWRASLFGLITFDDLEMDAGVNSRYHFRWNTLSGNALATRSGSGGGTWTVQVGARSAFSEGGTSGSVPMGGGNRYWAQMARIAYSQVLARGASLQVGVRGEHDRFQTANREDALGNLLFKSSDKSFALAEAYADATTRLAESIELQAGGSLQAYRGETRATVASPRIKITWGGEKAAAWVDYAKTAQFLGLYPYFTVKTPVDIWYPLGKGDKPATCRQISAGASLQVSEHLGIQVGVFHKNMRNVKDFTREPATTYDAAGERQIQGKGEAKGMEINLSYHRGGLHARGNYTLSTSTRTFAAINDGRPFSPPYDVKHHVVLNLFATLAPRLSFTALWSYSSGVRTTLPTGIVIARNLTDSDQTPVIIPLYKERYNYQLPANHRLDVGIDRVFSRGPFTIRVTVGAYNLYNHPNPSFIYLQPEEADGVYQRLVPRSKILLPFIPHLSIRINR